MTIGSDLSPAPGITARVALRIGRGVSGFAHGFVATTGGRADPDHQQAGGEPDQGREGEKPEHSAAISAPER
jgi:hypothetical protein